MLGYDSAADRKPVLFVTEVRADAVQAAIGASRPGDAVLLSPGCTSFDQFVDFAARGRRFAQIVVASPDFQRC